MMGNFQKYCEEKNISPHEARLMTALAAGGIRLDSERMKKVMGLLSLIRLDSYDKMITRLEEWQEIAPMGDLREIVISQVETLKEIVSQEGLRLGRQWGELQVRDDDSDDESIPVSVQGFVGYKLGDTIYIEMDNEIAAREIENFHARTTFKLRNGHSK